MESSSSSASSASPAALLRYAHARISERSMQEGWTPDDVVAAALQASLLSYQPRAEDKLGPCIHEEPHRYVHMVWENWTPPSLSKRRASNAAAKASEAGRHSVRVHLSASQGAPAHTSVIAFASIKKDASGETCLSLRRGSDVLACLPVASLRSELVEKRMLALQSTGNQGELPRVFLRFADTDRLHKFRAMLRR